MKTISNTLLLLVATLSPLLAEKDPTAPPTAFIRVVNGVAQGTGQLSVVIDGENKRPDGYNLGDATGGMGMKAGSHKVTFKREGVKEGTTTVVLEKDQTVTLIPFAERVPATDQVPMHYEIRVLRLKQKEVESGRMATFASVSAAPELKIELGGKDRKMTSAVIKRLTIVEMPLNFTVGYAPASVNGIPIEPLPIGSAGNYVVVLYDDAEGKVQSIYFRDFKFLSAD